MYGKIWKLFALAGCLLLTNACVAFGDTDKAEEGCVGHRDYPFTGDGPETLDALIKFVEGATSHKLAVDQVQRHLGKSPDRSFVTPEFVRVSWLLESSRKSERIDCTGKVEERFEWDFAIVEAEWREHNRLKCDVFRKREFDVRERPDPYQTSSPLDSTTSCESHGTAK